MSRAEIDHFLKPIIQYALKPRSLYPIVFIHDIINYVHDDVNESEMLGLDYRVLIGVT